MRSALSRDEYQSYICKPRFWKVPRIKKICVTVVKFSTTEALGFTHPLVDVVFILPAHKGARFNSIALAICLAYRLKIVYNRRPKMTMLKDGITFPSRVECQFLYDLGKVIIIVIMEFYTFQKPRMIGSIIFAVFLVTQRPNSGVWLFDLKRRRNSLHSGRPRTAHSAQNIAQRIEDVKTSTRRCMTQLDLQLTQNND